MNYLPKDVHHINGFCYICKRCKDSSVVNFVAILRVDWVDGNDFVTLVEQVFHDIIGGTIWFLFTLYDISE